MKIAFIGNCQVQSFSAFAAVMLDGVETWTFDYSQPYAQIEENRRNFSETLFQMDYVFAQSALLSFTSEKALRPFLGTKLITIANFYFRGLFPDSCYVGTFETRLTDPSAVNSLIVLDAFRCGLSEEAAARAFTIETIERLGLLDAWPSSMNEMRKREANNVVDVPAAQLIEDACKRYQAFLTMNHPSARLVTEYLSKVFYHVGLKHRLPALDRYPDPLAEHDMTPVYDFIADYYQLEYRTPQAWMINSLGRRFISRENYIAAFYSTYSQTDPATLLVHSPTDMVENLRQTSFRYLVDKTETPLRESKLIEGLVRSEATMVSHRQLALSLAPLKERLDEAVSFIHKIHSFAEVVDPKVERLAHELLSGATNTNARDLQGRLDKLSKRLDVLSILALVVFLFEAIRLLARL